MTATAVVAGATRRPLIDRHGTARAAGRYLVVLLVVLAAWYAAAWFVRATGDTAAAAKLPYPHEVLAKVASAPRTFLEAAWATGSRAVVGFLVGLAAGLAMGILMAQSRWIEWAFLPYLLAAQMIPLIALVPILRAVFRDGDVVRLYVAGYVSFFIVTIAVLRGLKGAAPVAIELMESLDAPRRTVLRYLQLPAALPFIFSGLRIAAPLSLIGAILVDFLGARSGVGYLLIASLSIGAGQATVLWAALIMALLLGLLFTRVVVWFERRMCFWAPAYRGEAA